MQKAPAAAASGDQDDVYALTTKGKAELNAAGTALSAAELNMLVLVDGHASAAEIAKAAPSLAPAAVRETLDKLVRSGHIGPTADITSDAIDAGDFFTASKTGFASLQHKGYFVRIARRAEAKRQLAKDEKLTILVIEDDPQLAKLLRMYFMMEGFVARMAANREEIAAALRQPPRPDIVLLDATLPDVDGFDVLARMRQHDALKSVPVIMVTAKATREAVLDGLRRGADGYVTKPFEIDVLAKAVKSVLGLA